jgi:hypothetical protein
MSFIYNLSEILVQDLLMSWVNPQDIGLLDSATCNKTERVSFLSQISGAMFIVRRPVTRVKNEVAGTDQFVAWLLKRHVAVAEIIVTDFFARSKLARREYLRLHGAHIRRVLVDGGMKTQGWDVAVRDLCSYCPNVLTFECHLSLPFKTQSTIAVKWKFLTSLTLVECIARDELVSIAKNCRSLVEVSLRKLWGPQWAVRDFFSSCSPSVQSIYADTSLEPVDFIMIASRCPQLRFLRVPGGIVNNSALIALGAGCPLLKALDWNMNGLATDAGVTAVARNGALTVANLEFCSGLTDRALRTVAECCPQLECVHIKKCRLLTDTTLISIGRHCPNLRNLCMDATNMTRDGIESIAAGCPLLEELRAASCAPIGPGLVALARGCARLSKLMVSRVGVPAEAVRALAEGCPLLEEIDLRRSQQVGDMEITVLVSSCPCLTRLDIACTAVTEVGLCAIRDHCKKLKRVTLQEKMLPNDGSDDSFFPVSVAVDFGSW